MILKELLRYNQTTVNSKTTIKECRDLFDEYGEDYIVVLDSHNSPKGIILKNNLFGKDTDSISTMIVKDYSIVTCLDNMFETLHESNYNYKKPMIMVDNSYKYLGVVSVNKMITNIAEDLKFFRMIGDCFSFGIAAVDIKKRTRYYNSEWKRIHSLIDSDYTSLMEGNSDIFPESPIYGYLSTNHGNENIDFQPIHFKYSNATVLPSYHSLLDEDEVVGAVAFVNDYSKINHLAINISDASEINTMMATAFNNLSELIITIDKKLLISYSNPAFINTFGQSAGESLKIPSLLDIAEKYFINEPKAILKEEVVLKDKFNNPLNFFLTGIPLIRGDKVKGLIMIIQDLTTVKKLSSNIKNTQRLLKHYEDKIYNVSSGMIVINKSCKRIIEAANRIAGHPVSVLIEGENGVGKELVANYIHSKSDRANKPFVPVNCGAIPENLWESEMFGYEEGAFTGAKKGGKAGYFELADGGTIFLDEIGELPINAQVKLLRLLQNMEVVRLGGVKPKKLDVRVISATNRKLEDLTAQNLFRTDLYYRLNVIKIVVPPLRERRDEILPLSQYFLDKLSLKYHKNVNLAEATESILINQEWPGNVRQLRNAIEYSVAMCDGDVIYPEHLPYNLYTSGNTSGANSIQSIESGSGNLNDNIRTMEKRMIEDALRKTQYNKTKAMELLGISRKTFYKKLKDYEILNSSED